MELLQCQFWDGGGLAGAPLPAETRNCGAHRIKLKSPDWKSWRVEISHVESEAGWNKNPRRAENFHSVPASLVIWCVGSQATRSWRVFESGLCLILSECNPMSWLLPFTGLKSMVGTVVGWLACNFILYQILSPSVDDFLIRFVTWNPLKVQCLMPGPDWTFATERWFQNTYIFSGKHVGLLAQFGENSGFGRPLTWPFQIPSLQRWCLNWPAGR